MAWIRPDAVDPQPGDPVIYTNTGAHAIHMPDIKQFRGTKGTGENWYTDRGLSMGKPQFIWIDDDVEPAPDPGTFWQHRNGTRYQVMALANMASRRPEYPPTVVYVNISNGTLWTRPVADWYRSMTRIEL